ncbi:RidA family protein [Primorskyibacter sedentarius]|uniref:RidA family protein n=1 Tax=Primorskyibacter sedentarius TaxID=745311 RepID=UPI003EB903F7
MTNITLTSPPDVTPAATYEHVAVANGFAFLAGQVARDADGQWVGLGDPGAQARQVYKNIGRILAHIGARPDQVVKVLTFSTDRAHGAAISEARLAFFGDHRPPHSGILINGLGSPEVLVEVEVVVALDSGQ